MAQVKRSLKSQVKKRPHEWEASKIQIAIELGPWPKVQKNGWAALTAEESGRIGGIFSQRMDDMTQRGIRPEMRSYLSNDTIFKVESYDSLNVYRWNLSLYDEVENSN